MQSLGMMIHTRSSYSEPQAEHISIRRSSKFFSRVALHRLSPPAPGKAPHCALVSSGASGELPYCIYIVFDSWTCIIVFSSRF